MKTTYWESILEDGQIVGIRCEIGSWVVTDRGTKKVVDVRPVLSED